MFLALAVVLSLGSVATQAEPPCTRLSECRQLALDAYARQDFEAFHSLAWRAIQAGPPNDPDLMFMLARAQALSGRPDDAVVMLRRLVDRGIAHPEVETLDDFARVRNMAGWPTLLERMHGTPARPDAAAERPAAPAAPAVPSPPSPKVARPEAKAPAAKTPPEPPAPAGSRAPDAATPPPANLLAVPPAISAPASLAYDKVSSRLIIADDSSGTLKVLSELSGNAVDLVSRGWGDGYQTTALLIDSKRGDLWVVGTRTGSGPDSIVHRLQLISGRLLYSVPPPDDSGATRFAAVAMSAASVFVLDAEGGRIFELGSGARTMRLRTAVPEHNLTGLTLASDTVAYVAHSGGIVRIDLAAKQSEKVKSSDGVVLDGIEWIGYFDNSLLAVQRHADGTTAAVRFRLDRRGRTAIAAETLGAAAARGAAVVGDMFFYMSPVPDGTAVARVNLRPNRK